LEEIGNTLPDALTDYKDVTKSLNHVVNASNRVKLPNKVVQPLLKLKRGTTTKQDDSSRKRPRGRNLPPTQ
jgi:hypothetical protein